MSARSERCPLLHERVVRIRVPGHGGAFVFGSGCVVAPEKVLTARHVLARKGETPEPGRRCEVQAWPCVGPVWSAGTVTWVGEDEQADVAVLTVPDLLPDVTDVTWGRLAGSEPVHWFATGFPVAGLDVAGRVAEQVSGTLGPASGTSTGTLALTYTSRRPRALEQGSAWAGLSGAAVFVEARLVGVVVKDSARFDDSLIGLRVSAFSEEAGLHAALGRAALVLDPVGTGASRDVVRVNTAPAPDHSVVGREEALRKLKEQLRRSAGSGRVAVTVSPGIGKTELARALAHDPELPTLARHGVLWADLGANPDCQAILGHWARMLGVDRSELVQETSVLDRRRLVQRAVGQSELLVVLDDLRDLATADTFLNLGPNCLYLATTRDPTVADELAPGQIQQLDELNFEASLALLHSLAPQIRRPSLDQAVRRLARRTGGMPLALVLVGKRLSRGCRGGDPERCAQTVRTLHDSVERLQLARSSDRLTLREFIQHSLDGLDEDVRGDAVAAFQALSALRPYPGRFDTQAAAGIAGVDKETVWALWDAGFLRGSNGEYSMPTPFADYGRELLGPQRSAELNHTALRYYSDARREKEDEFNDSSPYGRRYRYEEGGWQRLRAEWLYHLAQIGELNAIRAAYAHTFLEAHYWWGYYVRNPFCDELLELDVLPGDPLVDLLRSLDRAWPRHGDEAGAGEWAEAVRLLRACRRLLEVDTDVESLSEDARYVRLVSDLLLAHALRRVDPATAELDRLYTDANALLEGATDLTWMRGWTLFRQAEVAADLGAVQTAVDRAERAILVRDEEDEELLACSHRLLARLGDPGCAAQHWVPAVLAAYTAALRRPKPPDFYNRAFLEDVTEDCSHWLREVRLAGAQDLAVAVAMRIRGIWPPSLLTVTGSAGNAPDLAVLLAADESEGLHSALFPPVPTSTADRERLQALHGFLVAPHGL